MIECPYCHNTTRQVKAGMHEGMQRYKCMHCLRRYVNTPRHRGYPDDIRKQAVALYENGVKIRQIGRELGLNPRSITNWVSLLGDRRVGKDDADDNTDVNESPKETPFTPVMRRPTIIDVAETAGVSVSTISNYLNNKGRMSDATRERIRESMKRLNFTPNSLVRAIRQRRTHIIGVVIYGLFDLNVDMERNVTPHILSGINKAADENQYNVLLYTGWPHRKHSPLGLDFLDGYIDGLIWVGPETNTPELDRIAESKLPTVELLSCMTPNGVGYVASDNRDGMLQAVSHLVELGHKRIAYAGPINASDYIERIAGYKQALRQLGIEYDASLLCANKTISKNWVTSDSSEYVKAVDKWLSLDNPPTAIMTSSDRWAEWMINELNRRGLRVPDEMAVVGFDDVTAASYIGGGITTVRQPLVEIGKVGVYKLTELINGASYESCRVLLPTELVIRSSTLKKM